MNVFSRRNFISFLLRVPIVAGLVKIGLFSGGSSSQPAATKEGGQGLWKQKFLAVRTLRLLNTAERRYYEEIGQYAPLSLLSQSSAVNNFLDSKQAEDQHIGRELFSTLKFNDDEILPGWHQKFKLAPDRSQYVLALVNTSDAKLGAFSTDHHGGIHEGAEFSEVAFTSKWVSSDLLLHGNPIEHSEPAGGLEGWFKTLAFGPVSVLAQSGCCTQYPCTCAFSCQGGAVGDCTNCGCDCCVWCCRPY